MLKAKGLGTGHYDELPRGLVPCGSECSVAATMKKNGAGSETTETNTTGVQDSREQEKKKVKGLENGLGKFPAAPEKMNRGRKKDSGKQKGSPVIQRAVQVVLLLLLVVGPVFIGWLLQRFLRSADQAAQRAWRPDNVV